MGSGNDGSQSWLPPAPQMLPLGHGNIFPPGGRHPVSTSLPTWDSVIGQSRKEKWVYDKLEWAYPRFYINKPVRDLAGAVARRLNIADPNTSCMLFSSTNARKCATSLREASPDPENESESDIIHFCTPADPDIGVGPWGWASFSAVVMPSESWNKAMAFWRDTGSGLSTRHAEFCLEVLHYLGSESSNKEFCAGAPRKGNRHSLPQSLALVEAAEAAETSLDGVKSILALIATSEQPGQPTVSPDDVFLYPTGMNAIFSLSENLLQLDGDSRVAAFGWLYPETVEVLRAGWGKVLAYRFGTEREYNHLEESLESGKRIKALFCEIPSNTTLYTPDLRRIRALADKYGFIVACDNTVAGYHDIDALPYVDVMISSLTKSFSGASNVTGGGLVLNPGSRYHSTLRKLLNDNYEKTYFPLDIAHLLTNCQSTAWRVNKCNKNTLPLGDLFASHPTVAAVHHPSTEPTSHLYKSLMRKDGGYGNLLSVVFHNPRSAEHFYNILDTCKGSSFGTNFTLAVPYVQLANYWNQDKVVKYGVPRHIIRISVGLEEGEELVEVVARALEGVVEFEARPVHGVERSLCTEGNVSGGSMFKEEHISN